MNHMPDGHLTGIDQATLTPLVYQVLEDDSAEILDWEHQPLLGGEGDLGAGFLGVYRFTGHSRVHGEIVPWALVLKSARVAEEDRHIDYLTREWFAYSSGFLEQLSENIVAPRCYGTVKQPDGLLWIWLESVEDAYEQPWSLERYAQVAYHFGQWNGGYLTGGPLPDYGWFCRSTSREWSLQAAPEVEFLRESLAHPLIRQMYPNGQAQAILRLWDERVSFFRVLEQLPQTICHNDVFRRNLFGRRTGDGRDQTVVIDWAYLGWGAVGEEAVTMVLSNLIFAELDWTLAVEFTELIFDAYLAGLRDAGWQGDSRLVRLGFTAAAAMKHGFPYGLRDSCTEEGQAQVAQLLQSQEDALAEIVEQRTFILNFADEARSLMAELNIR